MLLDPLPGQAKDKPSSSFTEAEEAESFMAAMTMAKRG